MCHCQSFYAFCKSAAPRCEKHPLNFMAKSSPEVFFPRICSGPRQCLIWFLRICNGTSLRNESWNWDHWSMASVFISHQNLTWHSYLNLWISIHVLCLWQCYHDFIKNWERYWQLQHLPIVHTAAKLLHIF